MADLVVFCGTEEQHVDLRSLFERIRKFGLKLSTRKSLLDQEQINFLGRAIPKEGARPDRSR